MTAYLDPSIAPVHGGDSQVEPLIDGVRYLGALYDAIARTGRAGDAVLLLAWILDADWNPIGREPLGELLASRAARGVEVRVLLNATPSFGNSWRANLTAAHKLRALGPLSECVLLDWSGASLSGSHHQKAAVVRLTLADIRAGVADKLLSLRDNACVVVDAETQADLDRFTDDVLRAAVAGKRFLFRSAASLLTSFARLPPQAVAPEAMSRFARDGHAGAVIIGSHVPKSTRQLQALLKEPDVVPIEVDVAHLPHNASALLAATVAQAEHAHRAGKTPAIYTSRVERTFPDQAARLAFGEHVSAFLMDVVRNLPRTLGWLVSKGGITSNDVLSTGLGLRTARLLGQILPGVSVVRCPADHARYPDMPVVIFPGNVGDDQALATVYRRLSAVGAKPAVHG